MTSKNSQQEIKPLCLFRDEQAWTEQSVDRPLLLAGRSWMADSWSGWVPASLWFPLRGSMAVRTADGTFAVAPGSLLVVEHGTRIEVRVGGYGDEIGAVLLPGRLVEDVHLAEFQRAGYAPSILPERIDALPALAAELIRLVPPTTSWVALSNDQGTQIHSIVAKILRWQMRFEGEIARCRGRNAGDQRSLFARLHRARNAIELTNGVESSLEFLAKVAQLSPYHFMRTYRQVFGLTPYKHATKVRFELARELLLRTGQPIEAIGKAVGMSSRSVFSRAFRAYHGMWPSDLRHRAQLFRPVEEVVPRRSGESVRSFARP